MTKEYRARVFRSGNSSALRIPKELGLVAGEDMVIIAHSDGRFSMWRKQEAKQMFLSLAGSMSPDFMRDGRGDSEQRVRAWGGAAERDAA